LIALLGLGDLRSWYRIVGNHIAHEFGESLRLYASVSVDREAVAMNFDRMAIKQNVAFN